MNWTQAFARQAASDLEARDVLAREAKLPACHALHFLQMSCEKLCKAARIAAGADPMVVQRSHASVAKHLPNLVKMYMARQAGQRPRDNWIVHSIRPLARKIELLSPAVRAGGRSPQNCEYPWIADDGVSVIAPADHRFDFSILFEKSGITLLKIMRQAAIDLQQ